MDIFDAVYNRRSVRSFREGQTVLPVDLEKILSAAVAAPSAMNRQPWAFVVVSEKESLRALQQVHPYASFLPAAGTGVVVCVDQTQEHNGMGVIDASLAAQNIMLAAHALGYGTCFCGLYPDSVLMKPVSDVLGLPKHVVPLGLIAMGVPEKSPSKMPPRVTEGKTHFEHW